MPAPRKPNTAEATKAVVRRGDETAAKRLRDHGWYVVAPEHADTVRALPDVSPDAVRSLHAQLTEADDDGASSNDWTQIVDDWFTANGFPTILYRTARR